MKIVRFLSGGKVQFGKQLDGQTALAITGDILGTYSVTDQRLKIEKLLAPIVPADILCIGLNYRQHAQESGSYVPDHPMLFIKSGNALNDPSAVVLLPRLSQKVDYEGELAIIIGKTAKNVSREQALSHVLGYTIANDVSARDWQMEKSMGGGQFARGKSFDGFCPIGPCIVTADEIPNPNALRLRTTLNGQTVQESGTSDMIFDVPTIIASLSSTMTIRAGAIILTGTPHGVGMARKPPVWLKPGDTVAVEIDKIGVLENKFAAEA